MNYTSKTVFSYHFKYGSSRYFTTLITLLPDGTRFEWSRNEDGLIFFSWEEGKRVTFFRLMQEFGMSYSIQENFNIITNYDVWDASHLLQEAKLFLEEKKQLADQAFINFLYEDMTLSPTSDDKKLRIDWKGKTVELSYGREMIMKDYEQREHNFMTCFLSLLLAQYLLVLMPEDCAVDGEKELTWCAKRLIGYAPATLLLGQYSELTDELSHTLSASDCQSLYLNGLRKLPFKTAEHLSRFKGRLFLDGLSSIPDESFSVLIKHSGRYLSMRGLILDKDIIKKMSSQYDGFLRIGKKTESSKAEQYSQAELEASIVTDRKKFNALSKLLTSDTKDQIDSGLLMFSSLNDAPAADTLLEGISYFRDDNSGVLVLNNRFKTTLKRQPLMNYALMGIIYHAPTDSKIANRLREEVVHLQIDLSDLTYLGAFPELRVLELINSLYDLRSLNGIGECSKLEEIDLTGCEAITDIEDVSNLPVSRFRLGGNRKIVSLTPLQGKLDRSGTKELNLCKFDQLTSLDGIEFFSGLEKLYLNENSKLVNAAALSKLPHLKSIKPEGGTFSITLPSLIGLEGLLIPQMSEFSYKIDTWSFDPTRIYPNVTNFKVECRGMTSLSWLLSFPNLKSLSIECPDLSSLDGIEQSPQITNLLLFKGCFETIDPLVALAVLERIDLSHCSKLKTLDVLSSLSCLKDVNVVSCPVLEDISGWISSSAIQNQSTFNLYRLPALQYLGNLLPLTKVTKVRIIDSLSSLVLRQIGQLPNLMNVFVEQSEINVADSGEVITFHLELKGVKTIIFSGTSVRKLTMVETELTDLSGLAGLTELEQLVIVKAKFLATLKGIESLSKLTSLQIENAGCLTNVSGLAFCAKLVQLTLRECLALKDVNVVAGLHELKGIDLRDTRDLLIKPQAYQMNADQVLSYQQKILKTTGAISTASVKEKKTKLKNERAGTVDKKAFSNIKKLLLSRDLGQIDTAIQLIASIHESPLFDMLLEGTTCSEGKIVRNKIFDGTGPAQPFLDYGLLHVLAMAAEFDNWRLLCEGVFEWNSDLAKLGPLSQFTNLKKATLSGFDRIDQPIVVPSLKELYITSAALSSDLLSGCTGLEILSLSSIQMTNGIEGLSAMPHLKTLKLRFSSTDLTSLSPLAKCSELKEISISGPYNSHLSLISLSPLSQLTDLQKVELDHIDISDTRELSAMSWLKDVTIQDNGTIVDLNLPDQAQQLTRLRIKRCPNLKRVISSNWPASGLYLAMEDCGIEETPLFPGAKSFNDISLTDCPVLRRLDSLQTIEAIPSLSNWMRTKQFSLKGCSSLQDISGIRLIPFDELVLTTATIPEAGNFSSLKRLTVPNLKSLAGIAQFSGLTQLNLYRNEVIAEISFVRELPNLERLTLRSCKSLTTLEGIQYCKNLKHLNLADTEKLSDISALDGMMIEEIFINGCLLKKSDFPAHLQDYIDWQTKPD